MGRDLRSIVLSPQEAGLAVKDHLATAPSLLVSPGNVAAIELLNGEDIQAEVRFHHPLLDGRQSLRLDSGQVIEVILKFVQAKGHPLPRLGKKSLTWIDSDIAVMIELDWF